MKVVLLMKYVAIVGTNATKSYNRKLLHFMRDHFANKATIEIQEIVDFPLFNEDTPKLPQIVVDLANKIKEADGVIFGVPEYDHSIPAALKSVIEWLSNDIHPLTDKPIMIVGTSLGSLGTSRAQDTFRNILNAPGVDACVLYSNEFLLGHAADQFDHQGNLKNKQTINFLDQCFDNFQTFVKKQAGKASLNNNWDRAYDVVVLGFGGAGATAARFAADNGANVLLVDKAPFGHEGGNTRYSAQHVGMGHNEDKLRTYYHHLAAPMELREDTLNTYVHGMSNIPSYFKKYLGITPISWRNDIHQGDPVVPKDHMAEYPELPGSETFDFALVHKRDKDAALWKTLRSKVVKRSDKIDIWLDSPAKHLIQNPENGAIVGVVINRNNHDYRILARNGVVLATGGFENNPLMVQTFIKRSKLTPIGTLYNQGDGIKMAQEVRARLWHMANYESHGILAGLTFKEQQNTQGRQINGWQQLNHGSIFVVGDDGTRYFAEDQKARHGHIYIHGAWRLPLQQEHPYLVFDQRQKADFDKQKKEEGCLPYPEFTDKLVSAPTLSELAAKINLPVSGLEQTVKDFNAAVEKQHDILCDRDPQTMRALADGPYYAIALASDVLNTQGGPERTGQAEIVDINGKPIPNLYGAGELGGICANNYQGGGNLAECLVFGKVAGENAAKKKETSYDQAVTATIGKINDVLTNEQLSNVQLSPHEYLGSSEQGIGGTITVKVKYENQQIEKIDVLQQHESAEIGQRAIEILPQRMIDENTVDVDAVSGASSTTRGLKDAVNKAIMKANNK